jgi:hypothetical protein
MVGGETTECRQPADGLARGGAGSDIATRGEERGICDEKVGFACSLADRAGPSPLFSRPESWSAPRGGGAGMAWDLRMDEGPNLGENEKPGARLGRITPFG